MRVGSLRKEGLHRHSLAGDPFGDVVQVGGGYQYVWGGVRLFASTVSAACDQGCRKQDEKDGQDDQKNGAQVGAPSREAWAAAPTRVAGHGMLFSGRHRAISAPRRVPAARGP